MLSRISLSLDKVEQTQAASLTNLEERIDTKARRIRSVLRISGLIRLDREATGRSADRSFRSSRRRPAPAPSNDSFIA
jgi:hypothetical protein